MSKSMHHALLKTILTSMLVDKLRAEYQTRKKIFNY